MGNPSFEYNLMRLFFVNVVILRIEFPADVSRSCTIMETTEPGWHPQWSMSKWGPLDRHTIKNTDNTEKNYRPPSLQ